MKTLDAFIRRRPYWAIALSTVLSVVITVDVIGRMATGAPPDWISYVLWTGMVAIAMWADKRLLTLALSISLLAGASPVKAQEPEPLPLVIIGGVVILGLGGIVGCRAYKKCSKISKSRTNAWPEELQFMIAGEPPEYGAAFAWGEEGYCIEERLLPQVPVSFVIDIAVESLTNSTVSMSAKIGYEYVQTFLEFQEEMAGHGLVIGGSPQSPESCFSLNRHPCEPEHVPVRFDFETRTVTLGAGGALVMVERSANVTGPWQTLMKLEVAPKSDLLRIEDATAEGSAFYRVTTGKAREP